jgi:hypothetical protein
MTDPDCFRLLSVCCTPRFRYDQAGTCFSLSPSGIPAPAA